MFSIGAGRPGTFHGMFAFQHRHASLRCCKTPLTDAPERDRREVFPSVRKTRLSTRSPHPSHTGKRKRARAPSLRGAARPHPLLNESKFGLSQKDQPFPLYFRLREIMEDMRLTNMHSSHLRVRFFELKQTPERRATTQVVEGSTRQHTKRRMTLPRRSPFLKSRWKLLSQPHENC